MMKKQIMIVLFVQIFFGLYAQGVKQGDVEQEPSIINAMVDRSWTGSGSLMGSDATFKMDWQKVLDDKFIKLEFQNERRSKDDGKLIKFGATGFYQIVNNTTIVGNWYDNRGITFPLIGTLEGKKLTVLWGSDGTEQGKTIYSVNQDDKISVYDFILIDGVYRQFGSASYNLSDRN